MCIVGHLHTHNVFRNSYCYKNIEHLHDSAHFSILQSCVSCYENKVFKILDYRIDSLYDFVMKFRSYIICLQYLKRTTRKYYVAHDHGRVVVLGNKHVSQLRK